MNPTPVEAAAIALALELLCAPPEVRAPGAGVRSGPSWSGIGAPRTWQDFARREALALDADV